MKYIAVVIILLVSVLCQGQSTYQYQQPSTLDDGWSTTDLITEYIDTLMIYGMFNQLMHENHKLHSVVVVKNNQLIIEEYFDGQSASEIHDLRSTTKSIRALLMGIAIDQGFIENVDDPITKYLKQPISRKHLDNRKASITIKHLLTMSTGLECNDWDKKSKGQEDKVYKKKDWLQYTLDLPMARDPGTEAQYCSMGAILVAEIISQASGMTIDEFADRYLFSPLGITQVKWGHTSKKKVIPSGKRLYMTPRDMAKIGQLVLNHGMWEEQRVVSESWIKEATSVHSKITGIDYGYFWWSLPFAIDGEVIISKTATGNGGQYIMVFPDIDLVAVFTGGAYNSQDDKLPFAIMNDIILPAFYTDK